MIPGHWLNLMVSKKPKPPRDRTGPLGVTRRKTEADHEDHDRSYGAQFQDRYKTSFPCNGLGVHDRCGRTLPKPGAL